MRGLSLDVGCFSWPVLRSPPTATKPFADVVRRVHGFQSRKAAALTRPEGETVYCRRRRQPDAECVRHHGDVV